MPKNRSASKAFRPRALAFPPLAPHGLPALILAAVGLTALVSAAALAITAGSAQAASFDCNKAGNTIEWTICGDSRLSELDSEMGSLYRQALRAPFLNSEAIRADQRRWLRQRNRECGRERDPYYCLGYQMEERVKHLQQLLY